MKLSSPHVEPEEGVAATPDNIAELIPRLVGAEDPFAIVGDSEQTYAQVLWVGGGFTLEHQAGSIDQHFRADRAFTPQEIVDILVAYAAGSPAWSDGIPFARVELRSPVARFLGRVAKTFSAR